MSGSRKSRRAKKSARKRFERNAAKHEEMDGREGRRMPRWMPKRLARIIGGFVAFAGALAVFTTIFGPLPELASCARKELVPCSAGFVTDKGGGARSLADADWSSYARNAHALDTRVSVFKNPTGIVEGTYWFDSACSAEVLLHNNRDEELLIKRVRVVAEDVRPDELPYVKMSMATYDRVPGREYPELYYDEIGLTLVNEGWGDARDLTLTVEMREANNDGAEMDGDPDPSYFMGSDEIEVYVGDIAASESKTVSLFQRSDLVSYPKGKRAVALRVTAVDGDGNEVRCGLGVTDLGFFVDDEGYFLPFAYGADIPLVAGILIDAHDPESIHEHTVSTSIGAGENLHVPIFFFPDMSCWASVRVEFDIADGSGADLATVKTDDEPFHFDVSTIERYPEVVNLDDVDGETLEELLSKQSYAVSYPWRDAYE